jgi:hypothetical protein
MTKKKEKESDITSMSIIHNGEEKTYRATVKWLRIVFIVWVVFSLCFYTIITIIQLGK